MPKREVRRNIQKAKVRYEVGAQGDHHSVWTPSCSARSSWRPTSLDDPKLLFEYSGAEAEGKAGGIGPPGPGSGLPAETASLTTTGCPIISFLLRGVGDIRLVDRETWRRLISLPPEEDPAEMD